MNKSKNEFHSKGDGIVRQYVSSPQLLDRLLQSPSLLTVSHLLEMAVVEASDPTNYKRCVGVFDDVNTLINVESSLLNL